MTYSFNRDGVTIDLSEQESDGVGFQATRMGGLGLAPIDAQFIDQGDGASYHRSRNLPRNIDIEINVIGSDYADLKDRLSTLSKILRPGQTRLRFVDSDDEMWFMWVARAGGFDFAATDIIRYGGDDARAEVTIKGTLKAGVSYWTASEETVITIAAEDLTDLSGTQLPVSINNPGDVAVYPVWDAHGPGSGGFLVGDNLVQDYMLVTAGLDDTVTLRVDALNRRVTYGAHVDPTTINAYADITSFPAKFYPLQPGTHNVYVGWLTGTDSGSVVTCTFSARKWIVL